MSSVARALTVVFINIEGLKSKINNENFSDLLQTNHVFDLAESWAGFETYNIKGYTSYIKGRNEITRFRRNLGGLVVYVKNSIRKKCIETSAEIKEVIWTGV
jgi:hypothetical protein